MITCRFEDGGQGTLRHVTVSGVIVNKERTQVLLARRAPHLSNGGLWCLPGGYLDRDETTAEAVCREAFEETGYEVRVVSILRFIDQPTRPKEDKQNVEFAYVLEAGVKKKEMDKETSDLRWFDLASIPPETEWAYDHYDTFRFFLKSLQGDIKLPVFNNNPL